MHNLPFFYLSSVQVFAESHLLLFFSFACRLNQRGLKNLKDRTRLQNVEHRLAELTRDITYVRKELSFKPG